MLPTKVSHLLSQSFRSAVQKMDPSLFSSLSHPLNGLLHDRICLSFCHYFKLYLIRSLDQRNAPNLSIGSDVEAEQYVR